MSGDERARLQAEMQELTQGTLGSLDDLEKTADMKALNKVCFAPAKDTWLSADRFRAAIQDGRRHPDTETVDNLHCAQ